MRAPPRCSKAISNSSWSKQYFWLQPHRPLPKPHLHSGLHRHTPLLAQVSITSITSNLHPREQAPSRRFRPCPFKHFIPTPWHTSHRPSFRPMDISSRFQGLCMCCSLSCISPATQGRPSQLPREASALLPTPSRPFSRLSSLQVSSLPTCVHYGSTVKHSPPCHPLRPHQVGDPGEI